MRSSESVVPQKIFIRTRSGWFIREARSGDDITSPFYYTRQRNDGTRVDEIKFNKLLGFAHDIYITTYEYKKKIKYRINFEITSTDPNDVDVSVLQLPLFSDAGQGLMDRIENLDITKPIEIRVGHNKEKDSTFIWLMQQSMNIPKRYTKAAPEDKPQWKSIQTAEGTIWDQSDQLRWWNAKLVDIRLNIQNNRKVA